MPASDQYPVAVRAVEWFASLSRPDLGHVAPGAVVYVTAEHAGALTASPRPGVKAVAERVAPAPEPVPAYRLGEHIGGGVYTVLDAVGAEVDRVKGQDDARARVQALLDGSDVIDDEADAEAEGDE